MCMGFWTYRLGVKGLVLEAQGEGMMVRSLQLSAGFTGLTGGQGAYESSVWHRLAFFLDGMIRNLEPTSLRLENLHRKP